MEAVYIALLEALESQNRPCTEVLSYEVQHADVEKVHLDVRCSNGLRYRLQVRENEYDIILLGREG